ncbi:NDP-sugar synthase [Chloroflexia bacterium SDU3-3]|nr:NDP-sugar synthase [Chloroflexia bacterium SDU3-3]
MKAVILVGGLGTRLRPLTCNTPKPMIPLVNQPFIEHMLENLRDQGITEAILAVQYLAERFREALGDGSRLGIKVHIVEEPEPRGTAGAVKNVEHMLDGPTFVFNGDVMTDLDLRAMYAFHQERQSKLTIALTPVEDPTAFGLVETNPDGRIRRFLEKPRPEDVTTNMINAGTYIMEPELLRYAPANEFYMFERGLFPTVLEKGDLMFGYPSKAYWTDIGKPQAYIDVHHDILMGKVRYGFRGNEIADEVWAEGEVQIAPTAQIHGPVVLGPNVIVKDGAVITGPAVIGANCVIGEQARLEDVVLWDGAEVGEGAEIEWSVIGRGSKVGAKARISDGAIIGDSCTIGAENHLTKHIRIWPGTQLNDKSITF